jgi:hypothetical protein
VDQSRDLSLLIQDLLSLVDDEIEERLRNFIGYVERILNEEELSKLLENLMEEMSRKTGRVPSLGFVPPPWTRKDIIKMRKAIKKASEFLVKEKRKKVEEAVNMYF